MSIPHPQYNLRANRAHQDHLMSSILDDLEAKMDAQRDFKNTLTEEELEKKYGHMSERKVDEKISTTTGHYETFSATISDGAVKLGKQLAELRAEKERRRSKTWLHKAQENQAEAKAKAVEEQPDPVIAAADYSAQEDAQPSVSPAADGATLPAKAREREATFTGSERKAYGATDTRGAGGPSAAGLPSLTYARDRVAGYNSMVDTGRKRKLIGGPQSFGERHVNAAIGGANQRQSVNGDNLFSKFAAGQRPGGANRPGSLKAEGSQKGKLLLKKSTQGQPPRASGTNADAKTCVNGCKQQAGLSMIDGIYICQSCRDVQNDAGNGAAAKTRSGKAAAHRSFPDDEYLLDTRNIQEPAVRGVGVPTNGFYGSNGASTSGRPQARGSSAEDEEYMPNPSQRPRINTRNKRKQAQQDNEPITLDDTDEEEEAGPGPSSLAAAEPLRRSERTNIHQGPSQRFQGLKALYPAGGGPGAVEITPADLARLEPEEFLNDTIIDFFMRHIWESLQEDVRKRCYFFNSFFWKKLTEKSGLAASLDTGPRGDVAAANHERVKKWTKALDIFEKDFLFVPIHDHLHWSLLIVCNPGADPADMGKTPCMLHLDSMSGGHPTPGLRKALCAFLTQEWDRKVLEGGDSVAAKWVAAYPDAPQRNFDLPAKRVTKLPMQDNHCDCGLFLLTYLDFFTHGLPKDFCLTIRSNRPLDPSEVLGLSEYPLFLHQNWFYPGNASKLRRHLRWLLLKLFVEQVPEDQRESLGDALAQAIQDIDLYQDNASERYHPPAEYFPMGYQRLKEQLQDEERRKQDKQRQLEEKQRKAEEVREAKRQRSQTSAQLSPGSLNARRRNAAEAAERRRNFGNDSADQEDIEIVVEGMDAPSSQESPERDGGFHVHSKEQDGPLDTHQDSPDRVCAQERKWRTKGTSKGSNHRSIADWPDEDDEPDVQVSKEVQSIDVEEGNGAAATPTARGQSPKTRLETPEIPGRYQRYFRLHQRYGDDDRLLNVLVMELRPALKPSAGVGSHIDEKEHEFPSEAAAYEFMDYCLKAAPSSSGRLPAFQQPQRLGGSQRSKDMGIVDWSEQQPLHPATTSSPVVTLLGSPSPPSKGKVSQRTRSHGSPDMQQNSTAAARHSIAATTDARREETKDAAHAAHDLTADEDEPHEDTWGTILAETRPPGDAAPDINRVAQAAFNAVEHILGPVESTEQPAPAHEAPGGVPWLPSRDAAEKSQRSLEAALDREATLTHASKLKLPDEPCAHKSEQPSGCPGEERKDGGKPKNMWHSAVGFIRNLTSARSAGAASLEKERKKRQSAAHHDGFTSSDEDEPDTEGPPGSQLAAANGPAQIDLTSDSGNHKQGVSSPGVQPHRGTAQAQSTAEHAAPLQPLGTIGPKGPSSGQLPAQNGVGTTRSADLDVEVAGKKSRRARRRENAKWRRAAAVSPDLFTPGQQQGDAVSSEDDGDFKDCAPSETAALDPNLVQDVEADSQSPVVDPAKAAQEEADHRLAMRLQGQDNDGVMTNELSELQLEDNERDSDYAPNKEFAKRKRKGKGSPRHSPKKSKHHRRSPHAARSASTMQTPPSGQKNIGSYFGMPSPVQMNC